MTQFPSSTRPSIAPRSLRVLVTDDDPTYRLIVRRTLEQIEGVTVAGVAGSIAAAQARIACGDVDAVTIDVIMRDESGIDLLHWIQAHHKHLLTILLTAGGAPDARRAVDALLLGASALVLKPTGADAPAVLLHELARVLARDTRPSRIEPTPLQTSLAGRATREIIAVGASTGGPPVVVSFLKSLPASFVTPIVITQHISAFHVPFFVEMLAQQSGRKVVKANHGDIVQPGTAYVAGDAKHLLVVRNAAGQLELMQSDGPEEHHCKPAVDPMFRSVAAACGAAAIGVVISGMGRDGADGAVALRSRGAPVVAQDQATSVVWGMPGAVVAANAADAVLPGDELAAQVARWTSDAEPSRKGASV